MAPGMRKLGCFHSSCLHFLLTPVELQTFFSFSQILPGSPQSHGQRGHIKYYNISNLFERCYETGQKGQREALFVQSPAEEKRHLFCFEKYLFHVERKHGLGGKLQPLKGRMSGDGWAGTRSVTAPLKQLQWSLRFFCKLLNAYHLQQPNIPPRLRTHCTVGQLKQSIIPLSNPQASSAVREGWQRKNDIMKLKRKSKHHASSMCRSATDKLCLVCLEDFSLQL